MSASRRLRQHLRLWRVRYLLAVLPPEAITWVPNIRCSEYPWCAAQAAPWHLVKDEFTISMPGLVALLVYVWSCASGADEQRMASLLLVAWLHTFDMQINHLDEVGFWQHARHACDVDVDENGYCGHYNDFLRAKSAIVSVPEARRVADVLWLMHDSAEDTGCAALHRLRLHMYWHAGDLLRQRFLQREWSTDVTRNLDLHDNRLCSRRGLGLFQDGEKAKEGVRKTIGKEAACLPDDQRGFVKGIGEESSPMPFTKPL